MATIKEIRADLREIRYYYSKKKEFEDAAKYVIPSSILNKVDRYNQAVKDAPPQLYDLYISLYVHNNTQAALAYEWDFCNDHIKRLNKQLCEYFLKVFSNEKQGDEHE